MNSYYAIALISSAVISTTVAIVSMNRRNAPGATGLVITMLGLSVWALTYAIWWSIPDRIIQFFWLDAIYLGKVTVPTALLIFALQITNRSNLHTRRNLFLLAIEPTLTLLLLWTDPLHGLFFGGMRMAGTIFNGGVWFWINTGYSFAINCVVLGLFVHAFLRGPLLYRKQAGTVLIGILFPFIGSIIGFTRFNPFPDLDITPFAFTITGLVFAYGLFRFRLLDVIPIARRKLIESMNDGVIVVDLRHRIVAVNPAAQHIFRLSLIGQKADRVFEQWQVLRETYHAIRETRTEMHITQDPACDLEVHASPLFDREVRLTGWLIILHDVTESNKMEETLRFHSAHDTLTGLYNREYYAAEIERLQQSRRFPISILMIDMDGLKIINDRLGHSAGDDLLRQAAKVFKSTFRPEDMVARIGGDEFVVVLPNTDAEAALQVVQRLKNNLVKYNLDYPAELALNLSIGTASGYQNSRLSDVIEQADRAMYNDKEGKQSRRN